MIFRAQFSRSGDVHRHSDAEQRFEENEKRSGHARWSKASGAGSGVSIRIKSSIFAEERLNGKHPC